MRISSIPCKGLPEREQEKLLVNEGRLDVRVQYVVGIEPFCGIARRSGGRKFDVKVFMYESATYVWLRIKWKTREKGVHAGTPS